MLRIEENRSFKELTTFKIGGPARYFAEVLSADELREAISFASTERVPIFVLGGGSNMLVNDHGVQAVVVRVSNRGIEKVDENETTVTLRVGSGEVWDDVVKYASEHELWGIENLSRIPGRAGALAVQNVGAYGAEASQVILYVEVFDRKTNELATLANRECGFSYRKSIFNTTEKDRYVILYTTIALSKIPNPNLNYPDLRKRFEDISSPNLIQIRQAIKEIRDAKFPFPDESIEGNAGSFFKNSVLSDEEYRDLEQRFAQNIPDQLERLRQIRNKFPHADGIKIPSAFILDACGLKTYELGNAKLNPTQPVVVLNANANASAAEVLTLVMEVRVVVKAKTGLHLLTEPELIGFTADELCNFGFIDSEIARYCPA
jgi:UDP-N-acetylmuramate dehydrogenase